MASLTDRSRSVGGSVALVTGAASGMGRATAKLFADEGAHVAVTDLHEAAVAGVVEEIQAAGLSAAGWVMDVADAAGVREVTRGVAARWGRLDIVVNNAVFSRPAPIDAEDMRSAGR